MLGTMKELQKLYEQQEEHKISPNHQPFLSDASCSEDSLQTL